jgi:hypothetical protein
MRSEKCEKKFNENKDSIQGLILFSSKIFLILIQKLITIRLNVFTLEIRQTVTTNKSITVNTIGAHVNR